MGCRWEACPGASGSSSPGPHLCLPAQTCSLLISWDPRGPVGISQDPRPSPLPLQPYHFQDPVVPRCLLLLSSWQLPPNLSRGTTAYCWLCPFEASRPSGGLKPLSANTSRMSPTPRHLNPTGLYMDDSPSSSVHPCPVTILPPGRLPQLRTPRPVPFSPADSLQIIPCAPLLLSQHPNRCSS